jgi:hypothetical protein
MAGKKRSPTLEVSAGQQDERAINLGFDLVSWRGLALAGSLLVSVVLLAGATGNRLATIFGTLMVAGIALDLLLRPTRVTLGPEGLVRRGLRTSHMRYVDIVDVEHGAQQHRQQLVIHARSASWTFVGRSSRDEALAELARRLEDRLVTFRGLSRAPAAPLARGERDHATWTSDLRDLVAGERHGYRQATVSPEVLLRIAENPTSGDEERIAALVALSPATVRGADPWVRTRIAALALETAAPELREAVDAWLEEDEEVLDRMLHGGEA